MAAAGASQNGFSYAQAAKGQSSASPSSKVTSGVATPTTGQLSESLQKGNWADDVEASVGEKDNVLQNDSQEQSKNTTEAKSTIVRAKEEDKGLHATSGVSSPDLIASGSATSKDDDWSGAPNGASSESTWESKSSASNGNEPSWIMEREKRQTEEKAKDAVPKKGKKKGEKAEEPAKPVVLTESSPPAVNPWARRAEEAKAKTVSPSPVAQGAVKTAQAPAPQKSSSSVENQHPRAEPRKKADHVPVARGNTDAAANTNPNTVHQSKRQNEARPSRPSSKSGPEAASQTLPATTAPVRNLPANRQTPSNPAARPPPSVKDEVSWPTPDSALEQERKAVADKDTEKEPTDGKADEDAAASKPSNKKTQWTTLAVTPNIIWETAGVRDRGSRGLPHNERGGRGGSSVRARGGYRGAANGVANGERPSRAQQSTEAATPRGRSQNADRPASLQPAKAGRASSANSHHDRARDTRSDRFHQKMQGPTDPIAKDHRQTVTSTANGSSTSKPVRRAKSPAKAESNPIEDQIPDPIPPPVQTDAQAAQRTEPADAPRASVPFNKAENAEGRKGRSFDSFKEPNWNPAHTAGIRRGGGRGGRGRGGSREFGSNGSANHVYGGNMADFNSFNQGGPFVPGRGGHKFSNQNRGWHQQGPNRSQSIPIDTWYPRSNGFYPANTMVPSPIEYGYPMAAMAYPTYLDHQQQIQDLVRTQLDYYFSIDNMLKDMYLRKNMDSQGFVPLDLIAGFNRIKNLSPDLEIVKAACLSSEIIEIRIGEDGKERLRTRDEWAQFVLPMDQREPIAQNDGPQKLQRPEPPHIQTFGHASMQARGPASANFSPMFPRNDRRSYDGGFAAMNGMFAYPGFGVIPEFTNGHIDDEEVRGRSMRSSAHQSSLSPSQAPTGELDGDDVFPNGQIENLTVVVRSETAGKPRQPFHHLASRTFSNGSIDTRLIETDKATDSQPQPAVNGEAVTNGADSSGSRSRHASPSQAKSPVPSNLSVFWVKDKDAPVQQLPADVTPEPYPHLHMKALDQRSHAATGNCPYDMDVLYQFWSHFLIRNFNNGMYTEFKQLALEDAEQRHNTVGVANLTKYYSEALLNSKTIRDHVLQDYVAMVKKETSKQPDNAAFKQLRSAWRNGALNLKNRKKLGDVADDELKAQLEA